MRSGYASRRWLRISTSAESGAPRLVPSVDGTRQPGSRTREQYPHRDKTDSKGFVMAWLVLIVSGMLEAVWAAALSASQGFTRWRPAVLFVVSLSVSMMGLAWAMLYLPVGTAYAVWVGIGATLTVVWGFVTRQERPTIARTLLLLLLVGCVIGLKVVS